jgi:hypothetical protein
MLEYFDINMGVCLPACPIGSYYEIKRRTCVVGKIMIANSTSFYFNLTLKVDKFIGAIVRNRFVVVFSK